MNKSATAKKKLRQFLPAAAFAFSGNCFTARNLSDTGGNRMNCFRRLWSVYSQTSNLRRSQYMLEY